MTNTENLKPCDFEKWAAVPKWKMSEAACILSGYEPSATALSSCETSFILTILAKHYEEMYSEIENDEESSANSETWIEFAKLSRVLLETIEKPFEKAKEQRRIQKKAEKLETLVEDDQSMQHQHWIPQSQSLPDYGV